MNNLGLTSTNCRRRRLATHEIQLRTTSSRPEPTDNLGPIRMEYDEIFGREVKVRDLRIGMTRNAREENKKAVTYLEPSPLITRIDTQEFYRDGIRMGRDENDAKTETLLI